MASPFGGSDRVLNKLLREDEQHTTLAPRARMLALHAPRLRLVPAALFPKQLQQCHYSKSRYLRSTKKHWQSAKPTPAPAPKGPPEAMMPYVNVPMKLFQRWLR